MNSMFKTKLKIALNIQHHAEGDPPVVPPVTPPVVPPVTPPPSPQGKVWTDEYVSGLRSEAAGHRTEKQKYQAHVRTLMGLAPDVEINETMITNFQKEQTQAAKKTLETANARLLSAEIKSLQGYDAKLVERLLDKSKITIGEDGTITGLTEAVTALETEFPAIKVGAATGGGANPAGGGGTTLTEIQQLEEDLKNAPNLAMRIAIRNKIFALQSKK